MIFSLVWFEKTTQEGQGTRPKIAVCIRVRLRVWLSFRYKLRVRGFSPVARETETDKIKGVTRDKNCGVDKHPLFSLASPGPVIFSRPCRIPLCLFFSYFASSCFFSLYSSLFDHSALPFCLILCSRTKGRPPRSHLSPVPSGSTDFPRRNSLSTFPSGTYIEWPLARFAHGNAGKCAEGNWTERRKLREKLRKGRKGKARKSLSPSFLFTLLSSHFLIPVATNWFGFADSFRRANLREENSVVTITFVEART